MISCCMNCKVRSINCHQTCKLYNKEKALEEEKKKWLKRKNEESKINSDAFTRFIYKRKD